MDDQDRIDQLNGLSEKERRRSLKSETDRVLRERAAREQEERRREAEAEAKRRLGLE